MVEQVDITTVLTGFSTKIKSLEERQNALKEKTLLLGQSFLKQEETLREDVSALKDEMKEIRLDLDRIKEKVDQLIGEAGNFARKEELKMVEKYMKIWEPLKFVKKEEVQKMIDAAIEKENTKHEKSSKTEKDYIN